MKHFSNDISLVLGGAAGQGVQTVEAIVVGALKREGFHVYACKEYMSRVRGGSNSTEIRLGSDRRRAYVRRVDFLFALDGAVVPHLRWRISPETVVFGETGKVADRSGIGHFVDAPFRRIADEVGHPIYMNTAAAGVVLGMLGADKETLFADLRDRFARKGDKIVADNIEAAKQGFSFGKHVGFAEGFDISLPRKHGHGDEMLIDGHTALGLGALAAGCNFISSYPMSPGTGVLTFLAQHGAEAGVVVDQAEDEIAAINAALGASYAGARALVTTSGGGFALMGEGVSLAGMTETPVVVHIGMRPGPATGLPTRTEQGDLNLALYSGHGEFARAIYAPGTLEEGIATMQYAFRTADTYQVPTFVLSDQHYLDATTTMPTGDAKRIAQGDLDIVETDESYRRYLLTEDGISPRGIPGYGTGLVAVDSDEHDEEGHITESYEMRKSMMDKRLKRLDALRKEALMPTGIDNVKDSKTVIVTWGSNRGVLEEALAAVRSVKLGGLHFSQVYPVNRKVRALLKGKKVVVMENNQAGQFADMLERELGITVSKRITKYTGEPFCVEEVIEELKAYV